MKVDVCVFTHNPRREVFDLAMRGLASQTLARDRFHVWIIDNASNPALEQTMQPLADAGIHHTVIREERLGLSYAREKAIQSTTAEWVVFVDDDNELFPDYLAQVIEIASTKPHLGCFGGKLLLALDSPIPPWSKPLLPFLAIKDCGDEPITACKNEWGDWEPPGAGAVIRRPLLQLFMQRMKLFKDCARLGRKGKKGLLSAEDSLIMRGASALGLHCSYEPKLRLNHHINPKRLDFRYMLRLLYNYGRSHVILERSLGKEVQPQRTKHAWRLLSRVPQTRDAACRLAWEWGYWVESRAGGVYPSAKDINALHTGSSMATNPTDPVSTV